MAQPVATQAAAPAEQASAEAPEAAQAQETEESELHATKAEGVPGKGATEVAVATPAAGSAQVAPSLSSSDDVEAPTAADACLPAEAPSTVDLLGLDDPWDGSDSTPRAPAADAGDFDVDFGGSVAEAAAAAPGAVRQLIQELDGGAADQATLEQGGGEDAALESVAAKLSPIKPKARYGDGASDSAAPSGVGSSADDSTAASTPSSARAKKGGKGKRKGKKSR